MLKLLRTKAVALTASAVVVAAGLTGLIAGSAPAGAAAFRVASTHICPTMQKAATSAANYGSSHGSTVGVALIDRQTGCEGIAGNRGTFATESVVKSFVASYLLATRQFSGKQSTAWRMITQSNDAAGSALYPGDFLEPWTAHHYHIANLGAPPIKSTWWGGTLVTAAGLAEYYDKVASDPAVAPWLLNAMHHVTEYGTGPGGIYQWFGLHAADPNSASKQGWGDDYYGGQTSFNSTGYVDHNRYVMVLLARGGSYGAGISNTLSGMAKVAYRQMVVQPRPNVWRLGRHKANLYPTRTIHLVGRHFAGATRVMFGNKAAPHFTLKSNHRIIATIPNGTVPAKVGVTVTTPAGTSIVHAGDFLTYVGHPWLRRLGRDHVSLSGGSKLTVYGNNLFQPLEVMVNNQRVPQMHILNHRALQFVVPAQSKPGKYPVELIGGYGHSSKKYLYYS